MFCIAHKVVFERIEPRHLMIGKQKIFRNHLLVQVTSTQGHFIRQNVQKIEDKDHDD